MYMSTEKICAASRQRDSISPKVKIFDKHKLNICVCYSIRTSAHHWYNERRNSKHTEWNSAELYSNRWIHVQFINIGLFSLVLMAVFDYFVSIDGDA